MIHSPSQVDINRSIAQIVRLLQPFPDLLEGFNGFLPKIGQQACPTSPAGNRTPPQLSPEASPPSAVSTGTLPLCVEPEHAMQFIEEVEATYHDRPELYQSFLNLLRTYQLKHMGLEGEVLKQADEETFCQELINLFSQDHNLLNTFTSLLPSTLRGQLDSKVHTCSYNKNYKRSLEKIHPGTVAVGENLDLPPLKKSKRLSSFRDASLAAAGQYGTLRELSFFDKVRRALRSQEVYENFLRCIQLYNIDIISVSDLLDLIKPFLGKFPELLIQFKHLVGKCFGMSTQRHALLDRVENTEMDFSSCKRLGPSYRALPESYQQPKCSGRTALCREVLNDIWVSFPSWSEDSTFVSSKKTQYEEHIYRCEDERFE
uniref:paired amphipathic helix protein Sin3b-like n=1 Tax=Myxine glutinosa TaxID=7769 RepID=UPI00358F1ACD